MTASIVIVQAVGTRKSGVTVTVADHDAWELLCWHPGALEGEWDPALGRGWVFFPAGLPVAQKAAAEAAGGVE